jgi:phosphate transport system protein
MARLPYQDRLQGLRESVIEELEAVSGQLERVVELLETGDSALVAEVIDRDAEVDRLYGALQTDLVTVIARQAPVACDLRLITALLHITRMIERMGDQCVNIAKLVSVAGPAPSGGESFHACLVEMGRAAGDALTTAATAIRGEDLAAADALEDRDARINELNRSCFSRAIELGDADERRTWATAMILAARALERIADNAVDIGAHVRFAVTGTFEARSVSAA